jgi:hypothetical protein
VIFRFAQNDIFFFVTLGNNFDFLFLGTRNDK